MKEADRKQTDPAGSDDIRLGALIGPMSPPSAIKEVARSKMGAVGSEESEFRVKRHRGWYPGCDQVPETRKENKMLVEVKRNGIVVGVEEVDMEELEAAVTIMDRRENEMKKQTTANNEFLRQVKTLMNQKIYKVALTLVNTEGESSAREWLQQFFNCPVSEVFPK